MDAPHSLLAHPRMQVDVIDSLAPVVPTDDHEMKVFAEKEAAELTRFESADPKRYALHLIDAILRNTKLPPATQVSIAMLAGTLAVSRVDSVRARRGAVINAACNDFRLALQKYLPRFDRDPE